MSQAEAAVPAPSASQAVISVKVGGERQPDGSVKGLAGVTLALHGAGTGNTATNVGDNRADQGSAGTRHDRAWSWTTCTSDADGDCNFVIPIRSGSTPSSTGVAQDTRFWVVQESGPAGWYSNPSMRLGSYGATPEYTWQYRFRTSSQLRAGTTYRSTDPLPGLADWPVDGSGVTEPDRGFMRNRPDNNAEGWMGSNVSRTTGVWSESRTNPTLSAGCDLNVAVTVDTSGSLGESGMADTKSTLGTFVDAFRGTNTRMSLFSFSTASPGNGATNRAAPLPVTTAAQASAFKAQYAGWIQGGGTNWDAGFRSVTASGNDYDLVVLLTDGNPTVYGSTATGNSAYNSFQDVDSGIFSANALKAAGSRVVAVGVGAAVSSPASGYNLRAVSGQVDGTDYHRTANFAEAAAVLSDLAKANCGGSVQVQKKIVPTGGTIADATAAPAGWEFKATTSATGMTLVAPTSATTTSTSNGSVGFGVTFANPTTSGALQVLETQQAGYEVVPVGSGSAARNAECVNTNTGASVAVTNAGTTANPGFVTTASAGTQVSCTIYNTKAPAPGKLVVEKSSDPVSGTTVAPGDFIDYTVHFKNTGEQSVSVDHTDYLTDLLDDAMLVTAPTSSNANLTVTGLTNPDRFRVVGTVPGGAEYKVTYRAQVNASGDLGDGQIDNYVTETGTNPPTECDPATKLCTSHPVEGNLVLKKSSDPVSGTALAPGESATYTLTFKNDGGLPVAVNHDDVLSDVLDDANISNIVTSNSALTAVLSGNRLSITGSVPGGATYTVTYRVSVPDPLKSGGNGVLNNYLVPDGETPPTNCDEATELCTTHPIPGTVSVDKAVAGFTEPLELGDEVTYTLTFTHAGGQPAAVDYTDSLADVLDDAVLTSGPTVSNPALTATLSGTAPNQSIRVVGQIASGTPITVTYTAKVKTSDLGNATLDNCVVQANPGTDKDCTTTEIPGALKVIKTSDPASGTAVLPGQQINYTLRFTNTGGQPVQVNHTDELSELLDDATITAGPTTTGGLNVTPNPLGSATSFDVTGTLAGGTTGTVTYTATVKTQGLGDGVIDNFLVKKGTTPPESCEPAAGQDPTCTTHPVPGDLSVSKTSDPVSTTPVVPGQVVKYTLTFANGGGSTVAVDYTDYLADVLDDAEFVPGSLTAQNPLTATMAGNGQSFAVVGNVAGGTSLTVTYEVKVRLNPYGDGQLDNFVRETGTTPPAECVAGDALCTTHPIPGELNVVKDSTPGSGTEVLPGDDIEYTISFANTGGTSVEVDWTDDLSDALDDATVTAQPTIVGAAHGLTVTPVTNGTFIVSGDLAAGAMVQVKYTLTVNDEVFGNGTVGNVVFKTGTTPPEECVAGDPLCTEHPIPGDLTVKKSSDPVSGTEVAPGDLIKYTLTFANTGGSAVNVDYTDYLAALLDDATITADPTATGSLNVAPTPLGSATSFTVTGSLASGDTAQVTYTAQVKDAEFGDGRLDNFVRKTGTTPPVPGEECVEGDVLCTTHPVPGDLTVKKSSDPVSGSKVSPGDVVTYTLSFANGGGSAVSVDYTDHLAAVLDDAEFVAGSLSAQGPLTAAMAGDGQSFQVGGSVPAGQVLTVVYAVKVKAAGFGDGRLDNFVRETGTTPPVECVDGDALCTSHPVPGDLSVVKSSDPVSGTAVLPESEIDYTVTFSNSGGKSSAVDYTDLLADVLDDAELVAPPTSSDSSLVATLAGDGQSFRVVGDLAGGSIVTVKYTVKVNKDVFGDGVVGNVVVKTGETPPEECVAGDLLCTEHPIPGDLTVSKSSDPVSGTEVNPGEVVKYTLTFVNGGGEPASVDYTDYLAAVLDDAELTSAPVSSDADLEVALAGDGQSFTVTGVVPGASSYTVTYEVTVKDAEFGDGRLDNFVRPSGVTPPVPGEECVEGDVLCTTHPVPGDLVVIKDSDPTSGTVVDPGSEVRYTLTFTNRGGQASAVDYTDYLDELLDDAAITSDPEASDAALSVTPSPLGDANKFNVTGTLGSGATATVTYTATVKTENFGNGVLTNVVVEGDDTPGPCVAEDPLCTEHPVAGNLAVAKSSDPVSGTEVNPGDVITYSVRFANTGAGAVPVDHTDLMEGVLDDATLITNPVSSHPVLDVQLSQDGKSFQVTGNLPGETAVTVSYQVKVNDTEFNDGVLGNVVVKTGETPPTDCLPGDELCTEHPVPGILEVNKSADPESGTTVKPGDSIVYRLTFKNTGGQAVAVDRTDHLAEVLDDADLTVAPAIVGDAHGLSVSELTNQAFTVSGQLTAGRTVTVEYTVQVKTQERGNSVLDNFLMEGDEEPPATCDPAVTECTEHPVAEFKATKSVDPATGSVVVPGQKLTYTLTFANTGGLAHTVDYTDVLTGVFDDASLESAPEFVGADGGLTIGDLTDGAFTVAGQLAAGQTVQVRYVVKVKAAADRGDSVLANFLVKDGENPPSTCDEETELCTENPVGEFAVAKTVDPESGTTVKTDDTLTYTLTFRNVGAVGQEIDYTDHLGDVLDDAELQSVPAIDGADHGLTVSPVDGQKFTVTGTLAAQSVVKVRYAVKVRPVAERGDHVLDNFLVKTGENPPSECTITTQNCTTNPVGDLYVAKTVDPASTAVVTAGQTLTYRLTFKNRGAAASSVDYTDRLERVLDDAKLVTAPHIVGTSNGLSVSAVKNERFAVTGSLPGGATTVVEYQVKVKAAGRGDSVLDNFLVVTGEKPPSTCEEGPDGSAPQGTEHGAMCTTNPVGEFSVTKTADPASGTKVKSGDTVTYTLTFTNTGATGHQVDYTDHLADVLDDGLLAEDPKIKGSAHGLSLSSVRDEKFTVSGLLAPRSTVTVTYSVLVHLTGRGNAALVNYLVEGDQRPAEKCTAEVSLCTSHPIEPQVAGEQETSWLPNTGGPMLAALIAGLAALFAGAALLLVRRRAGEEPKA